MKSDRALASLHPKAHITAFSGEAQGYQLLKVAVNFLLIAGIAYFAARSVNDVFLESLQGAPPIGAVVSATTSSGIENHPRAYYDQIVTRDVFNLTPQEAPKPVVTTVDLHLKLLGTALASKDKPFAIIEDQAGEQSLYTLGDDIP